MVKEAAQIVYERLKAEITDSATPGLTGVKVWNEERPPQQGTAYIAFSVDTSIRGAGTAPISDLIVDVDCYATSAAAADVLAKAAAGALQEYTAVLDDVRVTGLQLNGSNRDKDNETGLWYVSLRVQGLVIG